jgi:hypothetical protein
MAGVNPSARQQRKRGHPVLRRLAPSLIVATLTLVACTGAPAVTDPVEIITQGVDATTNLKSFHLSLAVDGTFSTPGSGGSFALNGTSLEGDFDLTGKNLQMTFAVPALLGLTGEVMVIGTDTYVRTSMTGDLWSKSTAGAGDPVSEAMDPEKALAEVRTFLAKDGVETEKLDDVECGDRTCYAVRLTIPAELLADAGDAVDMDPTATFGEALVLNLRFDRENLWLTEVSTAVESESAGSFTATLTFSGFDEAVTVNPPPSDEVTESALPLPF